MHKELDNRMRRFRKLPVEIEAIQFTGTDENFIEITDWAGDVWYRSPHHTKLFIKTLEGDMEASLGDWIIKGVKGEFYPCKPDIFEATYEPVDEPFYVYVIAFDQDTFGIFR